MRNNFKPLGIVAAVAAVTAGYANVASAQTGGTPSVANNALGDLAIVPYYTVQDDWVTGIHVVNTSDRTQVVKFRLRRATDSLDALDFNIVMSPKDVWAGFISQDEDGTISYTANDTTCTAPAAVDGRLVMPEIYREGAETGYVEVIAMGSPELNEEQEDSSLISKAAKHVAGVPVDCAAVRSNFFADGVSGETNGVVSSTSTYQAKSSSVESLVAGDNNFDRSGNVLKVSYFIRDNASGVEFGDNAVHIAGFLTEAAITNQERGYLSGDIAGFDFPDLDGGVPGGNDRGKFALLRDDSVLGVDKLINEWSANPANGVAVDWVVTMPGQYTMLDIPQYIASLDNEDEDCDTTTGTGGNDCDYRDIPVTATIEPYNREELTTTGPTGELVVSPSVPGAPDDLILSKETNVITFGGNSVLGVSDVDISADLEQPFGWLSLSVTAQAGDQGVCDWDAAAATDTSIEDLTMTCSTTGIDGTPVPMVGFAAWQRSVATNPNASYGRIVSHSFTSAN